VATGVAEGVKKRQRLPRHSFLRHRNEHGLFYAPANALPHARPLRSGRELVLLSGATLIEAKLAFSDLRDANLPGADLTGADLTGANLLGANVSGAVLNYASLTEALITDEQLSTAKSRLG